MKTFTPFAALLLLLLTSALLFVTAGTAAAVTACSVFNVFPVATDCAGGFVGNDQLGADPSDYTVNELNLFGDSWELFDDPDTGGASTGEWSTLPGVLDYDDMLLTLKACNEFWAYLYDVPVTSGTYVTPTGQDLSHYRIYGRGDVQVPEPSSLLLLGSGLVGLGVWARQRRRN